MCQEIKSSVTCFGEKNLCEHDSGDAGVIYQPSGATDEALKPYQDDWLGLPVAIRMAALTMSVDTIQGTITYPGEKENHRLKSTEWDRGYVSSQGINHDGLNVVVKYPWMLQA